MPMRRVTEKGIMKRFRSLLAKEKASSWVGAISEFYDSEQLVEDYPSGGTAPPMKRWDGERDWGSPKEFALQIRNIKYHTGVRLKSDFMRRAVKQYIDKQLRSLAQREVQHEARLTAALLLSAETTTIEETGTTFFSTTHQYGSNPQQSNDYEFEITGEDTSKPEIVEAGEAVLTAAFNMIQLRDDYHEPMNEGYEKFHVITGPNLGKIIAQAIGMDLVPIVGGSGVQRSPLAPFGDFSIQVHSTVRLASWTNKFAIGIGDSPDKGIIHQEEKGARREDVIGEGSEHEKKHDEWLYGVRTSRGAGLASWQKLALMTLTT